MNFSCSFIIACVSRCTASSSFLPDSCSTFTSKAVRAEIPKPFVWSFGNATGATAAPVLKASLAGPAGTMASLPKNFTRTPSPSYIGLSSKIARSLFLRRSRIIEGAALSIFITLSPNFSRAPTIILSRFLSENVSAITDMG